MAGKRFAIRCFNICWTQFHNSIHSGFIKFYRSISVYRSYLWTTRCRTKDLVQFFSCKLATPWFRIENNDHLNIYHNPLPHHLVLASVSNILVTLFETDGNVKKNPAGTTSYVVRLAQINLHTIIKPDKWQSFSNSLAKKPSIWWIVFEQTWLFSSMTMLVFSLSCCLMTKFQQLWWGYSRKVDKKIS